MDRGIRLIVKFLWCLVLVMLASGCASTVPKPQFTKEITPESRVVAQDAAQVSVDAGKDVAMIDAEKTRMAEKVKLKIDEYKVANVKDGSAKSYQVDLVITRYDKGNAFARAMMAGLDQIHLDGDVAVYELPDKVLVGQFTISKTFAWGGVYGASTNIEDIETTFAEGVAATLTGRVIEEKKTSKTVKSE